MKTIAKVVLTLVIIGTVFSCASGGGSGEPVAGQLPDEWWTMSRGEVQNIYRGTAEGLEHDVIIFIGKSSQAMNLDENIALDNARMDAYLQLSRFLAQKVTGVQQQSVHIQIIDQKVANGECTQEQGEEMVELMNQMFSNFASSVTTTQFSSYKQEGFHTIENDDEGFWEAWVAYSMSDQVLEETREIQQKAFEGIMKDSEEYQEIMKEINEKIAESLKENITSQTSM